MTRPYAMIIEDDRDTVALFRHVLDLAGFITEIVLRGEKALERLDYTTPDIILLDLNLTGVSGSEIFQKIREDDRLKHISVIVITGFANLVIDLPSEPDFVLYKPVSIDVLFRLIRRLSSVDTAQLKNSPYDEPTKLYNHSFYINRLEYSIELTGQLAGGVFGVLYLDCDNFRLVEQQGKQFADQILVETADLLRTVVRPYDTISHFGSGQFFIQVEDLPTKEILNQIAERIHNRLTARILDAFDFEMTANIGMVYCDSSYHYPAEIIRDADIAMFYAKSNPHTNLVIFNPVKHGSFRSPEKYTAIMRAGSLLEDTINSQE
ncbi:MAG: GGDEF domain-containing response regulator [Anaerolineales bacterium]|jgi:diguanylate cyclase (GGDEF)-like protein